MPGDLAVREVDLVESLCLLDAAAPSIRSAWEWCELFDLWYVRSASSVSGSLDMTFQTRLGVLISPLHACREDRGIDGKRTKSKMPPL